MAAEVPVGQVQVVRVPVAVDPDPVVRVPVAVDPDPAVRVPVAVDPDPAAEVPVVVAAATLKNKKNLLSACVRVCLWLNYKKVYAVQASEFRA